MGIRDLQASWVGAALAAVALLSVQPVSAHDGIVSTTGRTCGTNHGRRCGLSRLRSR